MPISKRNIVIASFAALCVVYSAATVTVVEQGQEAKLTGEVKFDPLVAAKSFWAEQAQSYFANRAVDINTLLTEANGDFKNVIEKYGRYSNGTSGEMSFVVKGSGTVKLVKNKLRAGYIGIELDNYAGPKIDTRIQIGPVFKGSAVRDTIDSLNYKDYKNQIEWAQVSVAFHELILQEVLSPIDSNTLEGKKVEFTACFTVTRPNQILLTPVSLKVLD